MSALSCEKLSSDIETIYSAFGLSSENVARKKRVNHLFLLKEKVTKIANHIESISITRETENINETINSSDKVKLTSLNRSNYTVDSLDYSRRVKALAINDTVFTQFSKDYFETAGKLVRLQELYIHNSLVYDFSSATLKSLSIHSSTLREDFQLSGFPNLQSISLLNNRNMPSLGQLLNLKHLKSVRISGPGFTDDEKAVFEKLRQRGVKTEIIYASM